MKAPDACPIEIQFLRPEELSRFFELLQLFREVFETEAGAGATPEYLARLLGSPQFRVLVARAGDRVAGGLTAHVLPSYHSERPQLYLYDLAVSPSWQRQGIGRRLLEALHAYGTEAGFETVFVQADGDDIGAQEFYRAAGASQEAAVVHFTYALDRNHTDGHRRP